MDFQNFKIYHNNPSDKNKPFLTIFPELDNFQAICTKKDGAVYFFSEVHT